MTTQQMYDERGNELSDVDTEGEGLRKHAVEVIEGLMEKARVLVEQRSAATSGHEATNERELIAALRVRGALIDAFVQLDDPARLSDEDVLEDFDTQLSDEAERAERAAG